MSAFAVVDAGQCNESGGSAQGSDMEHTQIRPIVFAHVAKIHRIGNDRRNDCGCPTRLR
jgi:hypothetical protein